MRSNSRSISSNKSSKVCGVRTPEQKTPEVPSLQGSSTTPVHLSPLLQLYLKFSLEGSDPSSAQKGCISPEAAAAATAAEEAELQIDAQDHQPPSSAAARRHHSPTPLHFSHTDGSSLEGFVPAAAAAAAAAAATVAAAAAGKTRGDVKNCSGTNNTNFKPPLLRPTLMLLLLLLLLLPLRQQP